MKLPSFEGGVDRSDRDASINSGIADQFSPSVPIESVSGAFDLVFGAIKLTIVPIKSTSLAINSTAGAIRSASVAIISTADVIGSHAVAINDRTNAIIYGGGGIYYADDRIIYQIGGVQDRAPSGRRSILAAPGDAPPPAKNTGTESPGHRKFKSFRMSKILSAAELAPIRMSLPAGAPVGVHKRLLRSPPRGTCTLSAGRARIGRWAARRIKWGLRRSAH